MKKITINLLVLLLFIPSTVSAKSIYSPWHPKISSMTTATPHVYIYISGEVEANPAQCSKATSYVLHRDNPSFDEIYKALLAALISGSRVRVVLDDGPAEETCYAGRPKIKWINVGS